MTESRGGSVVLLRVEGDAAHCQLANECRACICVARRAPRLPSAQVRTSVKSQTGVTRHSMNIPEPVSLASGAAGCLGRSIRTASAAAAARGGRGTGSRRCTRGGGSSSMGIASSVAPSSHTAPSHHVSCPCCGRRGDAEAQCQTGVPSKGSGQRSWADTARHGRGLWARVNPPDPAAWRCALRRDAPRRPPTPPRSTQR